MIGFDIKHIREEYEELWNKDDLVACFPLIQEMNHINPKELIPHLDGKVLLAFLRDCKPKELRPRRAEKE
ncbi:hypothetical protein WMO63_00645 [Niallia sp. CLA-SR-H024]|uniref:Uncharacterized protein n=1 Tax=Niallia hominis TaxID=3133173 RepID=A0ABV1ESW2_9BACI